ncbi:MAG: UDP-N-acetylmuramoyl-L-alanine--D-glutamate ligase [Alphaproteobacteria bacterium CG11_big_fil_rev_8_21_14_0_20_39_49]|nr:MAG: UDP-N-acetylmuramoyl-L-alanine--D-glutamate ligase [Alphaproteobacteria bacterium CG11_big_fil_rev_8_21_14_0_20_39_49]
MINLDFVKGKKVVVFGLGKAGMSSVKALAFGGAFVIASDDSKESKAALKNGNIPNVLVEDVESIDWNGVDFMVLSPGVPFTHPRPHKVVKLAQNAGCEIICDIELLYRANPKSKFIGITGTNGKSTTTALIGHILRSAGINCAVGGNIGIAALDLENLGSDGVYVIEMSSYQLDLINKTKFDISVWLNITPDHLDRHGGIEGYIIAKKNIFTNQGEGDLAVIGVDDSFSVNVFEGLKREAKISNIIPISVNDILEHGVSMKETLIIDGESARFGIELGELKKIQGKHNAQNICAAYVVAKHCGVTMEDFVQGVRSFDGLPHRMQYVREENGVVYINDSKATNADAASKALETFGNIYWILGGVPKSGGIESLQGYFPKIKHAYLIGEAQDEFAGTLQGKIEFTKCNDLKNAFIKAKKDAESCGEEQPVVLLSPACASFDQWSNFEERGDAFIAYVNG